MKSTLPIGLLVLVTTGIATAGEKRDLGAHEHGVGQFNIALEGTQVAMELEAPGADIVGFEHPAESEADRAAIDAAKARLRDPQSLFVLPDAAGCTLASADVDLVGDHDAHGHEEDHDHDHEEHAHEEHGHDDHDEHAHEEHGHDDHDHDGHAHDDHGHDAHAEEGGHTEFRAIYMLSCADPSQLTRLEFAYFDAFPNARELEVQMIGSDGSRGFKVTKDAPAIELPGSS